MGPSREHRWLGHTAGWGTFQPSLLRPSAAQVGFLPAAKHQLPRAGTSTASLSMPLKRAKASSRTAGPPVKACSLGRGG